MFSEVLVPVHPPPPFLAQQFGTLMPNRHVWQAHLSSPQADPAGATGPPVTPVTPGPSGLSSTVSVFCFFRVRQKLPEADRKASHRLWPLAHARPAKAPSVGPLPYRPRSPPVEGRRPQDSTEAKAPLAAGLSPRITAMSTTGHCQRETDRWMDRRMEGRKGRISASTFPAPRPRNLRLTSSWPAS